MTNLIVGVRECPKKWYQWILYALQNILAALVATITVPLIINSQPGGMIQLPYGATLISAGIGTLIYLCFTKFKSPVFLSSSFAYLTPMIAVATTYVAADSTRSPAIGMILGPAMVMLVYVIVAIIVKFTGSKWVNKLLPPVVIGPVIMVIGLGLAGSAVNNLTGFSLSNSDSTYNLILILCGLVAMFITVIVAHYGKKTLKTIPFVIGMLAGYVLALVFTGIGYLTDISYLKVINFEPFRVLAEGSMLDKLINTGLWTSTSSESFLFLRDMDAWKNLDLLSIGSLALLFVPIALVSLSEHIGDHKNLSSIIGQELLEDPGMHRTVAGDGVATGVSGALSGCLNTSYGENVGVIASTGVASTFVIALASAMIILFGFLTPIVAFLRTIPGCVCGGVSLILYGFIANSGVKILINEKVDFNKNKNIFVTSAILVAGIGGLAFKFGNPLKPTIEITSTAVAMILGILVNLILVEKKEPVKEVVEVCECNCTEECQCENTDVVEDEVAETENIKDQPVVEEVCTGCVNNDDNVSEVTSDKTLEILMSYNSDNLKGLCKLLDIKYDKKSTSAARIKDVINNEESLRKLTNDKLRRVLFRLGYKASASLTKNELVDSILEVIR